MTQNIKTIDHINIGVVARYTETPGFKLAVCVGFGRDCRPRVRFYRQAAAKWSQPELVDRTHLAALGKIERLGPSRQHTVLTNALRALKKTPDLGFREMDLALLVKDAQEAAGYRES